MQHVRVQYPARRPVAGWPVVTVLVLSCLSLAGATAPAWAQKHPDDPSVDRPGDDSPSALQRLQPYSRKTEPLPAKPTHPLPRMPATQSAPTESTPRATPPATTGASPPRPESQTPVPEAP
ncbi:hypothetical protein [Novacetimonas pomaceti]|uniref:Uncharacterized protein n=1 Tax=Novacetimonas pomaceti TaxID=2021998 RepID=A0ABX5P627_9PROT|nr:hypothetical protein [Novacetimonas pomaceti]PYD49255.1 hypothetical protein C3920_00495 [Novacetimonas pomaceti]